MQTLKVKRSGQQTSVKVKVVRSWANADGPNIYLHHNGVYGYKDGAPVKSEAELIATIHAPVQQRMARSWWRAIGNRLATDYYAAKQQMEESASADYRQLDDGANSALDMLLYRRRGVKAGSAISGAKSWMEMGFAERPDWWGQARLIEFGEWVYERVDEPDMADSPHTPPGADQPAMPPGADGSGEEIGA